MKKARKLLAFVFLLALLMSLAVTASATPSTDDVYYHIRIYAGNIGTINGSDVYEVDWKAGTEFVFDIGLVKVPDDSYYIVRGIREAGLDNEDVLSSPAFIVTQDMDYVVAYGRDSEAVQYTVKYINHYTGEELIAPRIFWGIKGEKPVVAYVYIDDYIAHTSTLTQILTGDPALDVFVFEYRPVPVATPTPTPEPTSTPGPIVTARTGESAAPTETAEAPAGNTDASQGADTTQPAGTGTNEAPTQPEGQEQTQPGGQEQTQQQPAPEAPIPETSRSSTVPAVIGGVGILAVLAAALGLYMARKKKGE